MDFFSETVSQFSAIDEKLLLLLNGLHTPFFDKLMWTISDKYIWIPLYTLLAFLIIRHYSWKRGLFCIFMIILAITVTDQTCASFLRPVLERLRPSNPENPISVLIHTVYDYQGGLYGFPSCHAANSFALSAFISLCFRRRYVTLPMFSWATLVAYSRIYLGVHYPGDVLGGIFIGSLYALFFFWIYNMSGSLQGILSPAREICYYKYISLLTMKIKIQNIKRLSISIMTMVWLTNMSMATASERSKEQSSEFADIISNENRNSEKDTVNAVNPYQFKLMQIIVPATLIGVGIIGLESDWLKYQNNEIRNELQENIDRKLTVDDLSQYAPMLAVYGLDLSGVKSKHDIIDKTIILGTAYALMGISVNTLKTITKIERPDGSSRNSFPSGHTATAFMGAELLRREYQDASPWIGVAGYAVAAGTGFFRMYNNRHWLTDVVAGAGIGILSVKAAYWLYPTISKTFFRKRYLKNMYLSPFVSSQEKGLAFRMVF